MDTSLMVFAKTTEAGENNAPTLDKGAMMRRVRTFGETEGKGQNSRPALGALICEAARDGLIKPKTEEIAPIYAAYAEARGKAQFVPYVPGKSDKQQVSKLTQFAKLGALPKIDGPDLIQRTADICNEMMKAAPDIKWPGAYDQLLTVARYQVNHSPTVRVSDDVIKHLLTPKTEDKDEPEVDRIEKIRAAVEKMLADKDKPLTEETAEVLEGVQGELAERIKELGGTTKQKEQVRKAEEKEAAARATLVMLRSELVTA